MRLKRNTYIEYPFCYGVRQYLVLDVLGHIPLYRSEELPDGLEDRAEPYFTIIDNRKVDYYRIQSEENLVVVDCGGKEI